MIPYGKQDINEQDINSVVEVLQSDYLTQGPKIAEFETAFAKYVESNYAIAVSSGTAALHLCTLALGVDSNTTVITTPITFCASANCVRYCGGTVLFADIDDQTGLIDLDSVDRLAERYEVNGLIVVDYAGLPVDMTKARRIADKHGMWLIEDACHAPGGGFYDNNNNYQKCGNCSFADLSIFSFHPVKHIACGEGGMVTTNNEQLRDKIVKLRTHGITKNPHEMNEFHGGWYHEMQVLGFNYRISDIQASLGLSQLNRAKEGLKKRKEIAQIYDEAFDRLGISYIKSSDKYHHAYHLYVIKSAYRKELYNFLINHDIGCQVHYIPVYKHPYYKIQGKINEIDFPNTERFYEECLSIPIYPSLTEKDQQYVIDKIQKFQNGYRAD